MISLIIPMYNSEETIAGTLKSVIEQTVAFSEVIVVDNGSSDRSVEIVSKICQQYPHIHLFHCHEKGVSSARNMGLDVSQSPYIGFLDADDLLANDYVEIITASIKSHPDAQMYHFNFQQEFKNGIIKENPHFLNDKEIYSGSQFAEETLKQFSFEAKHMVWSFVFQSEFLKRCNLQFDTDVTIFEDILFLHSAWRTCKRICILNRNIITYVYNKHSLTATNVDTYKSFKKIATKIQKDVFLIQYFQMLSSRMMDIKKFCSIWFPQSKIRGSFKFTVYKIRYFMLRIKRKIWHK